MRKNKWLLLAISLTFFFLLAQTALGVQLTQSDTVQATDAELLTGSGFGPGSSFPLFAPNNIGYVYVTSKEPMRVTWTIFDPGYVEFTKLEHMPSTKYQEGTSWHWADKTAFVIPAFAEKGTWLAGCDVTFVDGSKATVMFGDNGEYLYIGIPVDDSGDWFRNLFGAPWYFLGVPLVPVFWFPLGLLWGPALFIGICYISPSIAETFKGGLSRLQKARGK